MRNEKPWSVPVFGRGLSPFSVPVFARFRVPVFAHFRLIFGPIFSEVSVVETQLGNQQGVTFNLVHHAVLVGYAP
jgi:hypothetical protein